MPLDVVDNTEFEVASMATKDRPISAGLMDLTRFAAWAETVREGFYRAESSCSGEKSVSVGLISSRSKLGGLRTCFSKVSRSACCWMFPTPSLTAHSDSGHRILSHPFLSRLDEIHACRQVVQ